MNFIPILPLKVSYNPFNDKEKNEIAIEEPEIQQLTNRLKQIMKNFFFIWKQDEEFKFSLPQSSFYHMDKPLITYHQPQTLNDNQQIQPLSQNQLQQIQQSGMFLVQSNFYSIPYKWKLNTWIYKGYLNRLETFYKDLSLSFNQLFEIPKRFTSNVVSVKKGMIRLIKFLPNIINVLVGIKKVYEQHLDYTQIIEEIRSFESMKINNRNQLYQYLYVHLLPLSNCSPEQHKQWNRVSNIYQKRLSQILKIDEQFSQIWNSQKKIVLRKLQQQYQDIKQIQQKYRQQMEKVRLDIIRSKFDNQHFLVFEDFLYYLKAYQIISKKISEFFVNLQISRKTFQNYIDQEYNVKKYSLTWRNEKVQSHMKQERERLQNNILSEIMGQINDPVFGKYCEIIHDQTKLEKVKKINPPTQIPNRSFQCTYKLFPPYQIQTIQQETGNTYILIKQKDITISTTFMGWKIILYFVRWYTWTRNIIYWLSRGLWGGRLGLKVLFYKKPFNPRYQVNYTTGQLIKSKQIQWKPILYSLSETWNGIMSDRRQFQEAPDNGFFGKTCSRICSLIYNYLIVFLIYMIFWLILIKPIVIILNVIMLTLISATAIVWIPIVLIINYFFHILIFNFQLDERYNISQRISERFFPIISMSIKFIYDTFYTIIAFFGIIYHPMLAFLFLLWGLIRITVKTISDFIMLQFIKCCARSPVRDTKIAWRVSGPGLSRDYYQTIKQQDIYILVLAELQIVHLTHLQKIYTNELTSITKYPQKVMNSILKSLNSVQNSSSMFSQISQSIYFYTQKLQTQINRQFSKFPNKPGINIRFTEYELQQYLKKSHSIVMDYITKHGSQFLYKQFCIDKEEEPEILTQKLWLRIFGNQDVFQPFQDLDHRFELVNDREDEAITSVLKVIKGSPDYKQKSIGFKFLKNKNKVSQQTLISINEIMGAIGRYRQRYFGNSKANIHEGLFFNYNIKDFEKLSNGTALNDSLEGLSES